MLNILHNIGTGTADALCHVTPMKRSRPVERTTRKDVCDLASCDNSHCGLAHVSYRTGYSSETDTVSDDWTRYRVCIPTQFKQSYTYKLGQIQ